MNRIFLVPVLAGLTLLADGSVRAMTAPGDTVVQKWIDQYLDPESLNIPMDLALDNEGNLYVAGSQWTEATGDIYATVKYRRDGSRAWVALYDYRAEGPFFEQDVPEAVRTDDSLNVYVTGSSLSDATYYDIATVKYNRNGEQQWVARFDGPLNHYDEPRAMTLDEDGNVYIGGVSRGDFELRLRDAVALKYDPAGNLLWHSREPNVEVMGMAIEPLSRGGSVYLTGYTIESTSADFVTIKYDNRGVRQWIDVYDGTGNDWDRPAAIALDPDGNIVVTGQSAGTEGAQHHRDDIVTIKYSPDGVRLWVKRYNGSGNGIDRPTSIAVDRFGNVHVAGYTVREDVPYFDFITLKYSPGGDLQWEASYIDSMHLGGIAQKIAVDETASVYVTGTTTRSDGYAAFATIKYDSTGREIWKIRYDGVGNAVPIAIGIDHERNIHVVGQEEIQTVPRQVSFTTVCYGQPVVNSVPPEAERPAVAYLAQNYPNPVNPSTVIRYELPSASNVILRVYNILGQAVRTLVSGVQQPGEHSVEWDGLDDAGNPVGSGVYLYRVETPELTQTRRLMLIR